MPYNSKLFIISGPSGVGKNTLGSKLLQHCGAKQIQKVITYTTRSPRIGEKDGVDYHFVTQEKFLHMVSNSEFLEYAMVHGKNYYGSSREDVESLLARDINTLLIIDPTGVKNVLSQQLRFPIVTIFVAPKNFEELKQRIIGRGTESSEEVKRRLQTAKQEMQYANIYAHIIESGSPEKDFQALLDIYTKLYQT